MLLRTCFDYLTAKRNWPSMGAIPQKWIFACVDCGCIFTTMAEKQTGKCPVCKSSIRITIEAIY